MAGPLNGAPVEGRGVPSKPEHLREWVYVSDGRRDLLGRPAPGELCELGMPCKLDLAFEVHDDDSWAVMGDERDAKRIPDKGFRGRRRNLVPLLALPNACACEILPTYLVRLSQVSTNELEYLWGIVFHKSLHFRGQLEEVIRQTVSPVQIATAMPVKRS